MSAEQLSLVPPKLGPPRSFGLLFAVLAAAAAALLWWHGQPAWIVLCAAAVLLALLAWRAPQWLAGPNRLWFRFGLLLGRIVNPIIMGLLFFAVLTPMALLRRRRSRRELGLDFDPQAPSYWKRRDPPGPDPQTFERQF